MRVTILFATLALCGCSRGFSRDVDDTDREPAHAAPSHPSSPGELPHGHPSVQIPVGQPGGAHGPALAPSGAPTEGGLAWTADAPLEAVTPDTPARSAQYAVHGEA